MNEKSTKAPWSYAYLAWLLPLAAIGASTVVGRISYVARKTEFSLLLSHISYLGNYLTLAGILSGFVLSIICIRKAKKYSNALAHGIAGLTVNLLLIPLTVFFRFFLGFFAQRLEKGE